MPMIPICLKAGTELCLRVAAGTSWRMFNQSGEGTSEQLVSTHQPRSSMILLRLSSVASRLIFDSSKASLATAKTCYL